MPTIYRNSSQYSGFGNGEYVSLTQAEYDALSEAEKDNGNIYFITDGVDSTEAIIGSEELHTQSDTITGAINELNDRTGQVISSVQSSDVTLPDQTRMITTSLSLPAGTWLIVGYQSFAYLNNTGGRRWLAITDNGTDGVISNVQYAPASSGATAINITCITSNNTGSNKTINLVAWQATATSGSLTASSGKIQAIRIC